MSSWLGTVGTVVRTDRKLYGGVLETSVTKKAVLFFFSFSPGILDIELRALFKPARCFTTELHSCGVGLDLQPGCLLSPCTSSGMPLCVGRGECLGLLETLGLFSSSSSCSSGNNLH